MDLEIRQHDKFSRRERRFNRVGWAVMALFSLSGLLGLLGPGPFSWAEAEGEAGLLTVEYQRVTHLEADDRLGLTVASEAVTENSVTIVMAEEWFLAMDVTGIHPTPESETATPGGLELQFATEPGTELDVQISFRPSSMGTIDGAASIDEDAVTFNQFVIP